VEVITPPIGRRLRKIYRFSGNRMMCFVRERTTVIYENSVKISLAIE
jgi:hypothetical protein